MTPDGLTPVQLELLQILRMSAERVDRLVTMFPDEWQLDQSDIALAIEGLEKPELVTRIADTDGVWWELTPEGRALAIALE